MSLCAHIQHLNASGGLGNLSDNSSLQVLVIPILAQRSWFWVQYQEAFHIGARSLVTL